MNKIIALLLASSFLMAGWTKEDESEKAAEVEAQRLCGIYTKKTQKYKETMRDDEPARATLANYERLQHKYCGEASTDQNTIE